MLTSCFGVSNPNCVRISQNLGTVATRRGSVPSQLDWDAAPLQSKLCAYIYITQCVVPIWRNVFNPGLATGPSGIFANVKLWMQPSHDSRYMSKSHSWWRRCFPIKMTQTLKNLSSIFGISWLCFGSQAAAKNMLQASDDFTSLWKSGSTWYAVNLKHVYSPYYSLKLSEIIRSHCFGECGMLVVW